jgi:uncharacterized protein
MWRQQITSFLRGLEHPAWGLSHCERTYHETLSLAATEGLEVREPVVFAVCYLHDIGAFARFARRGMTAPQSSAAAAAEILVQSDFPREARTDAVAIIASHDFERPPLELPEARCFHDADMLDFLGAVGIARLLSIVGLEDWTPDAPTAVEVARDFAERLPGKLVTSAGRAVAVERTLETRTWLAWLDAETADLAEL